jgi:hypothetical protein
VADFAQSRTESRGIIMQRHALWRCAFAIAGCALPVAAPALAQSTAGNNSASVDALANLVRAEEPLTLAGGGPLTFGQVTIPRAGAENCTYSVLGNGIRRIAQDGVSYGDGPSPAGCSYLGSQPERASMSLRCEADRQVVVSLRSESSGLQGSAVFFESSRDDLEVDGQDVSAWDQRCTGKDMVLRIGGQLQIRSDAQPTGTDAVQVGIIVVEAFYP